MEDCSWEGRPFPGSLLLAWQPSAARFPYLENENESTSQILISHCLSKCQRANKQRLHRELS